MRPHSKAFAKRKVGNQLMKPLDLLGKLGGCPGRTMGAFHIAADNISNHLDILSNLRGSSGLFLGCSGNLTYLHGKFIDLGEDFLKSLAGPPGLVRPLPDLLNPFNHSTNGSLGFILNSTDHFR